ncbi:MAG TPA: glycosyltransferase family 2 protein [Candidatus Acidoferrales bacterium]
MNDQNIIQSAPFFSVIVAVYNDWPALAGCLESLAQQVNVANFEMLIVDDGSAESAPETVAGWNRVFPTKVIRQEHAGISAARNRGIQESKGSILVFVDADCRMQPNCLAALQKKTAESQRDSCFQLRLIGNTTTLVGKAEQLRLIALQDHLLQADGQIRYLNTAGFAIRRSKVSEDGNLFNPRAVRAEDTLLLATLVRRGELPIFVPDAVVQHHITLSLFGCLRKDVRSAYLERRAFDIIEARGVAIQMTNGDRWAIMSSMWKATDQDSLGKLPWFLAIGRQALRLVVSTIYRILH